MLRLLSLLQTYRYWPGAELAERLSVSERTLRRDIDRLRELGYPVQANPGVAGGYQMQAGTKVPPILLDDEEAVAVAVGLRTAAGGSVAGIAETALRALAKLIQVMPNGLRHRVDALRAVTEPAIPTAFRGPTVGAGTLVLLAQACRGEERLRFDYTARDHEQTTRLVEPHRLVAVEHRWYLLAWDVERHGWRSFRVDRLASPALTGARFRPRELPGDGAAAYVQQGIADLRRRYQVRVLVRTSAANVERVIGEWGRAEPIDEDSCHLVMNVNYLEWPAMALGAIGAEFEVISPPELREQALEMGRLLTRGAQVGL
jgi:predicted DNA-binding transcriptional regulator YafY